MGHPLSLDSIFLVGFLLLPMKAREKGESDGVTFEEELDR
jgi:hypothetical protein